MANVFRASLVFALLAFGCGPKGQAPKDTPPDKAEPVAPGDGDGDRNGPATLADVEAVMNASGCADVADCAAKEFGARLCGGPAQYLVYCTTSTDAAKFEAAWKEANDEAIAATKKQADSGLSGICTVVGKPTLTLENGTCIGN